MRRRKRRQYRALADINIVNLVDVVLVLLIIFMISAPLLQSGIEVNLPKTKAAALEEYKILKRFDAGMAEMLFVRIY